MNLSTKTAELKFLTEADFQDMLQLFHEPGTFDYIEHLKNKSDEEYVSILKERLEQIRLKAGYHWVARTIQDNKLIGVLNLSVIRGTDKIQLGFQLSRNFWNQGLGFELANAVLQQGSKLGYGTIYGVFHKQNVASRKILQQLHFTISDIDFLQEKDIEIFEFNPRTNQNR